MRFAFATLALLIACGPSPPPAPINSRNSAWFCPKARFETCALTRRDCMAQHPGDLCTLTRPVFCEDDETCFATRYDCEYWNICYAR